MPRTVHAQDGARLGWCLPGTFRGWTAPADAGSDICTFCQFS